MKPLKIGIAGVRGIVGETLTPELVIAFAQAFGTYQDSGKILVCRDKRASGAMVRAAVISGLLGTGCEVIDLGICPTPTIQLAVESFQAAGGISITAGHNPAQWNALKFVRGDGLYLNTRQAEELLDIYHQAEFTKVRRGGLLKCETKTDDVLVEKDDIILGGDLGGCDSLGPSQIHVNTRTMNDFFEREEKRGGDTMTTKDEKKTSKQGPLWSLLEKLKELNRNSVEKKSK